MDWVLQSERLRFRKLTPGDLDFISEMLGHPEVMRFYPKQYSRDESRVWIERQQERYARDGHGLWLLIEKDSGAPVGQCGLLKQSVDGVAEPEVGYLLHRPFWKRGFATEAARAVGAHAFETLEHGRIISLIREENLPSRTVAERNGLTIEKRALHAGLEHLVYAITRERWFELHPKGATASPARG